MSAVTNAEGPLRAGELLLVLKQQLRTLVVLPLVVGLAALGITYVIAPTYTASTSFLPPQQGQSAAAAALGSLASLTGGLAAAPRNSSDQYVALMQSVTVSDRIIKRFDLMTVYEAKFLVDARDDLVRNVRMSVGKKDGLVRVEVDDESPQRAADMANRYVDELRDVTAALAVTEAQQRRVFFEQQMRLSRDRLVQAQQALQASGFNAEALKAEPRAAAEAYAKLKAEATATEVKLQALRNAFADGTPEVQQQQATLAALRAQLARSEQPAAKVGDQDYVGAYREFKYQETLFEMHARQYELARVDESREGALIQVVDKALPPEKRSRPKRAMTAVGATMASLLLLVAFLLGRHAWRRAEADHAGGASPAA